MCEHHAVLYTHTRMLACKKAVACAQASESAAAPVTAASGHDDTSAHIDLLTSRLLHGVNDACRPLNPQQHLGCDAEVPSQASGWCHCSHGLTAERCASAPRPSCNCRPAACPRRPRDSSPGDVISELRRASAVLRRRLPNGCRLAATSSASADSSHTAAPLQLSLAALKLPSRTARCSFREGKKSSHLTSAPQVGLRAAAGADLPRGVRCAEPLRGSGAAGSP